MHYYLDYFHFGEQKGESITKNSLDNVRSDIRSIILRFFVDKGFRMPTHIPDWINEEINEEVTHWMPLPSTEGLE